MALDLAGYLCTSLCLGSRRMLINCGWFREETQEQLKGLGMGMTGAQGGHMPKDGRLTLPGATEKRLRGNLSLSVSTCLGAVI